MIEHHSNSAVTRIRTWVVSATTRSTNHYTITAIASPYYTNKFFHVFRSAVTEGPCISDLFYLTQNWNFYCLKMIETVKYGRALMTCM